MTKLLDRPLKAFAIYSFLILIISIPAYFFVVDYIWLEELDEHNQIIKDRISQRFDHHQIDAQQLSIILEVWNTLEPGTSLEPVDRSEIRSDSIYEVSKVADHTTDEEADRFRGLQSYLEINGQPYRLNVETNLEEADETLLAIALVTFFFFLVLILGFIYLNKRIALSTWRPFYATLQTLSSFDLSRDKAIKLDATDIREFQELNDSLKKLVDNNISTYQQQKAFTENASHELQTPLALLKSKIDLLLQEKEITPAISEILSGIEAPLARLSRINKNLLLLAKVENRQYEKVETIEIKAYIENAIELFEDYAADKNLSISTIVDDTLKVVANPFLMETLVNNLLSNAIRHSPVGGQVLISNTGHTIQFRNSGSHALQTEHLFKRFSSASAQEVSSGLGLAIVQEIARRYGWEVSYAFQEKMHSFSVSI